jgi:hypothetical protein
MVAMVILVMLTLLGLAAHSTSALQERMAGNQQEMVRSFQDAESGLSEALSAFQAAPGPLTGVGFTADYSVVAWNMSHPFYDVFLSDAAAHNGWGHTYRFINFIDLPVIVDGTIGCYDGCDIELVGNVHVDGRDHDPDSCTLGGPASCLYDLTATPEPDIPAVYQAAPGTVVQSGSTTLQGATPVIATGGGIYTGDLYSEFVNILLDSASERNGSGWGGEGNPVIHVINQDGYFINANTTGAGILIITAPNVTINGAFRFEGLVIMAHPTGVNMVIGGGTDICGAIVATGPGSQLQVGGSGNPRITYCSEALSGAGRHAGLLESGVLALPLHGAREGMDWARYDVALPSPVSGRRLQHPPDQGEVRRLALLLRCRVRDTGRTAGHGGTSRKGSAFDLRRRAPFSNYLRSVRSRGGYSNHGWMVEDSMRPVQGPGR